MALNVLFKIPTSMIKIAAYLNPMDLNPTNRIVKLCASCSFFSFPSAKSQRFHCWSESQDASLL